MSVVTSIRASIHLHDGTGATPPLVMNLSSNVLSLLQRIDTLQRIQAGEDVQQEGTSAKPIDKLVAAEVEASLNGAVAEVLRCSWGRRENVRVLTQEEDERLTAARQAEIDAMVILRTRTEAAANNKRVRETAAELEGAISEKAS